MSFTFDIENDSTPISDVRLIIPDDVEAYMILDDAKIKGFLKL